MQEDDDFSKAFEGFGEDEKPKTPEEPVEKETPTEEEKPAEEPKEEAPKEEEAPAEEPKEEEPKEEEKNVGALPEEQPKPLTRDDIQDVVSNLLNTERNSSKELESTTNEVLEKYYPDGLSNTLVDERSGKELRTPQDVVDASGGEMSSEEAAQWLMNEQFKLDKQVEKIRNDAKEIAETTVNFKRDAVTAVEKYEPLFKAYPNLQQKVYDRLMKQVKIDQDKDVILSAPDVMEFYNDWLEPYQQAYEFGKQQPATNPEPPKSEPEPPKPTAEDRLDVDGDGGATPVNDPNDFAQQVSKELAKGQ